MAQDPITIKLSEKEGLPDVEFYDIIEDHKGFIWLAADKGLFRFDGSEYLNYSNKDKRGLSVFGLTFDNQNNLWCNNISGQFFKIVDNKLVLALDLKNELKGQLAEFLFIDDCIVIVAVNSIISINLKTNKRIDLYAQLQNESLTVRSPYIYKNKVLFPINDKVYTLSNQKLIQITNSSILEYSDQDMLSFFEYSGNLYLKNFNTISNANTFYQIIDKDLIPIKFPKVLNTTKIIRAKQVKDEIWFCTSNGIITLNKKNNHFQISNTFYKNDFITNFIEDKNHTFFVSTLNNGVFIIPDLNIKVFDDNVAKGVISAIEKIDDKTIAFGTIKGELFLRNQETQKTTSIQLNSSAKVTALAYLKSLNCLLISNENNSYILNLKNNKLLVLESLVRNAKDLKAIPLSNKFVLCGYNMASVMEFKNNSIVKTKELDSKRAYKCFYDKDTEAIYISFVDSFLKFDKNFNSQNIQFNTKNIVGKDICKTADGTIWIATFNDGIIGFKNDKFFKKIDLKNGLLSHVVLQLQSDAENLWILTDLGVQVYNTKNNLAQVKLNNKNTNIGGVKNIIIKESSLLFATQDAFFEMSKKSERKEYSPREIYIKSVTINERDTLVSSSYDLPYHKNRIKSNFHVNGYFPEEELQFQYRLNGLNENWISIEKNTRFVNFNSLPSGSYTFEIRCKTLSDEKFVSTKITFKINRPFWATWWFITLMALSAIGIIILFYRNKLAIKEKEKELALKNAKFENELAVLKLENLKSQMNPHFIFNALNSIQEYIILNQKNLASSYLAKFADLIRAYLEHSNKGYITIREEIECLDIYLQLEKLRFEDKFEYALHGIENNDHLKIPTMLIQPYVENAIKHGLLHKKDNRKLTISFELLTNQSMLKCIVLDNGIGRVKANEIQNKKHSSFATEATAHRLELLNFGKEKKIGVEIEDLYDTTIPLGTKVTLLIPILN
ncbi:sensor histidine kinase [Flavobacterium terrae]|uniref:Y_Y_Y domain-containing protein n=1 Tax=Flavobacterium terrae TaxID=415425 RepID=A0A1M6ARX0_9FLAO|nr:histidine kinase [Flavobacterium terrae]SHI39264.1 Y_Y_Y domain-containing protein [Flavobacterium terrae]